MLSKIIRIINNSRTSEIDMLIKKKPKTDYTKNMKMKAWAVARLYGELRLIPGAGVLHNWQIVGSVEMSSELTIQCCMCVCVCVCGCAGKDKWTQFTEPQVLRLISSYRCSGIFPRPLTGHLSKRKYWFAPPFQSIVSIFWMNGEMHLFCKKALSLLFAMIWHLSKYS